MNYVFCLMFIFISSSVLIKEQKKRLSEHLEHFFHSTWDLRGLDSEEAGQAVLGDAFGRVAGEQAPGNLDKELI